MVTSHVQASRPFRYRVFAMARPRKPECERDLVRAAALEIGATGSKRAIAKAVAEEVARLAIDMLSLEDFEACLASTAAHLATPAIAALAYENDSKVGELVFDLATAAFQARGCRHADPSLWKSIDATIHRALVARLTERFRR